MYISLKKINKRIILKVILLTLVFSTLLMLTACDDEYEMEIYDEGGIDVELGGELTSKLLASISDGEASLGKITDDTELRTGYRESQAIDNYDPDNPFKMTRAARPIRRIEKQDVYGNILGEEFYYYRNQLSKNEQRLYDQIYANAMDLDPYFTLTSKVDADRVGVIYDSVRMDNPDLFWLDIGYQYTYDNNDNVTSVTLDLLDMVENLDSFKEIFYDCADSVLEYVMYFDNDVDKVKYIHDFITNIVSYEEGPLDQSAYSAICEGETVCAGYSYSFQYFMQRLGIPSTSLLGYVFETEEYHAWSMIKLDDDYYELDITWDDPYDDPNIYVYDHFNQTTPGLTFEQPRVRADISASLPTAKGTRYSFDNWYGSDPGQDFSEITYGSPKANLPHIYPEFDTGASQNKPVNVDKDNEEDDDEYNMSDREELEEIIGNWSDEDWEGFWDELSEVLTDEELQEVDAMDWDEFIDMMYEIFYE